MAFDDLIREKNATLEAIRRLRTVLDDREDSSR